VDIKNLLNIYSEQQELKEIMDLLHNEKKQSILLNGLSGSSTSLILSSLFNIDQNTSLFVLNDREEAAYFYNDISNILGEKKVFFFPSSYKRSVQYDSTDQVNILMRAECLSKLNSRNNKFIIVTYPEALMEKVISRKSLSKNTLHLKTGEKISPEFLFEVLNEYEFEKTDFVYEPGQFSVRGSIIDIFSYSGEQPYRIDFFGDEVESIRSFNIENQLSVEKLRSISIIPNIQEKLHNEKRDSFLKFLPSGTIVWMKDPEYILNRISYIYDSYNNATTEENERELKPEVDMLIENGKQLKNKFSDFHVLESAEYFSRDNKQSITFSTSPQPSFSKNYDLLRSNLKESIGNEYENIILFSGEKQVERLKAIIHPSEDDSKLFTPLLFTLHQGFIDKKLKLCIYTDHQIFDRFHKFSLRASFSKKESISIKEITGLQPGDYIVHADHGIGQFDGLQTIDNSGKNQEAIRLVYKDGDILYVSIHSLHRISKYKGKEGETPKIYKLGSGAWQKLKSKTKGKIKDIAKDLIKLYAERKSKKGYSFSEDSYINHELEASFIYEDTPDQLKATKNVKNDMQLEVPMDRLICGDVGFGKTEVAIRAALKAAIDGKQTAILVPTTILALQHFNTFSDRLKKFPCEVDYISRLRSTKKQKESLEKLKSGKTDIIIGTHRLVSKDLKFKDLGLLIIDEEQKFGVAVKEKIKQLKVDVDTLTLTATPIPRTLQFSLMGARDLSIINTPPPNRHPIITELHNLNEDIIREAINYEVNRHGQVFFVHNRVQNILEVQEMISRICPKVNSVVAHGQMSGTELEDKMLAFIGGEYEVLISTTIIENGLDIPNANTIIINNAQNFGLSDLHQLRGRVGRSNKKAFCYLITPPVHLLPKDARRRLKAIEEFSELGSGINIAMQDLDIRGAGNLLGAEQSGFIADIGFETYQKILNEALQELKENEFRDLFSSGGSEDNKPETQKLWEMHDCQIDTDLEVLFPQDYIANTAERIKLYRELDEMKDEEKLQFFENNLIDRFGELPVETIELINVVRLRWIAIKLGIEKIIIRNNKLICFFISSQDSSYYNSDIFAGVLNYIKDNPKSCRMSEIKNKLSLSFNNITGIKESKHLLEAIFQKRINQN